MRLSIVTTLYNSAKNITEFHRRVAAAARLVSEDYEIVLVDDGSPDESLTTALDIFRRDSRVRVIELSRNFGHHRAIMTGLAHASGDYVFLIDSDLEEAPELLPRFVDEMRHQQADVVYGVQAQRRGRPLERLSGWLFYRLFNLLSAHRIPANLLTVRLMRRSYVRALLEHREREVCLAGLWAITGFRQTPLVVEKASTSPSSYTFGRRLQLALRAITSFSDRPLVLVANLGGTILSLSVVYLAVILGRAALFGTPVPGYTSLILSIWLLGGLTLFSVGIVGIYLARIFMEVKRRPYSIIRHDYRHETSAAEAVEGGAIRERSLQMLR